MGKGEKNDFSITIKMGSIYAHNLICSVANPWSTYQQLSYRIFGCNYPCIDKYFDKTHAQFNNISNKPSYFRNICVSYKCSIINVCSTTGERL